MLLLLQWWKKSINILNARRKFCGFHAFLVSTCRKSDHKHQKNTGEATIRTRAQRKYPRCKANIPASRMRAVTVSRAAGMKGDFFTGSFAPLQLTPIHGPLYFLSFLSLRYDNTSGNRRPSPGLQRPTSPLIPTAGGPELPREISANYSFRGPPCPSTRFPNYLRVFLRLAPSFVGRRLWRRSRESCSVGVSYKMGFCKRVS